MTKVAPGFLARKIARYASATCALAKLCATESRADIVMIDVGSTGFNINQVNGGLNTAGTSIRKQNFPISGGGNLYLVYKLGGGNAIGLGGNNGMALAVSSANLASVIKFSAGASIGSGSQFNTNYNFTAFKSTGVTAANFTTNDYVGFQFGTAGNYHYGWLQTTWDGTNFQINSGAYESTANTAILAGATAPVPEPGTLALGSLALLAGGGAAVRRYRKQRQKESAATPDATNPVTPVA